MQMRLLFLEFDGVLHPAGDGADTSQHFQWLDILVQLVAPWPDVGLVVRSTWRYINTPAELRALLGLLGPRFICRVPRGPRQKAIEWFLLLNPCFTSYLTVDDAPNEFTASRASAWSSVTQAPASPSHGCRRKYVHGLTGAPLPEGENLQASVV